MNDVAKTILLIVLCVICGGVSIDSMIVHFNKQQYFRFGTWAMITVYEILYMARVIFVLF